MLFVIMDSVSAFLGTPLDRSMSVTKASCYNLKNSANDYSFISNFDDNFDIIRCFRENFQALNSYYYPDQKKIKSLLAFMTDIPSGWS